MNWKFDNSSCEDEQYCNEMSAKIDEWIEECTQFEDIRMRWEYLKYDIRLFSFTYCAKKKKEINKRFDEIEKNVNLLSKRLDEEGERQIEEYRKAKDEYEPL